MDIVYERLDEGKIDTFIDMRINQLREEGATEDIDIYPMLQDYYKRHMQDNIFVAWLALLDDKIVGTCAISFVEKPPYFGCLNGKIGLLSSVYTEPSFRRQGIAKTLLSKIVKEAQKHDCGVVQITASHMGEYLYKDFGFEHSEHFWQFRL